MTFTIVILLNRKCSEKEVALVLFLIIIGFAGGNFTWKTVSSESGRNPIISSIIFNSRLSLREL